MVGGALIWLAVSALAPTQEPNPPPPLEPRPLEPRPLEPRPLEPAAALPATEGVVATRLVYVPGVFAPLCPSEADVRARVTQNLARDPFLEPAARIAVLVLEGESASEGERSVPVRVTRARLELMDAEYAPLGARTLEGDERCDELVAAAALALAIAIDPTRALAPPPALPPVEPQPFRRPPRVIVRDAPLRDDALARLLPDGTRLAFAVGGHSGALLTPGLQGGAHLGAALRGSWWGLGAALRTDVPAGSATGAALVTLLPCGHLALAELRDGDALALLGCATASAGAGWALTTGGGGGPYVGAGARAGLEWLMADASAIGLWAQLEWGLVRPGYTGGISAAGTVGSPVNLALGATFELGWPQ